jgi:hypothetical protein
MLQEVILNGLTYYADVNNQILYNDREKKSGIPFHFLSKKEKEQVEHELRFSLMKEEEFVA